MQIMDKTGNPIVFSMMGNCFFLCTFLLIGPVPFVPMDPSKHLIQVKNTGTVNCNEIPTKNSVT